MNKSPIKILEKYYGYKEFRKGQEEIINTIISGNDLLAIMPTGGGKSICYQVPALILEGITIVVSPLISLMKDQVDALIEIGVETTFINSTLSAKESSIRLNSIRNGEYKIIYVAPERLESYDFLEAISRNEISQIAIDEAHCVSQWGHDFRKSYKNICSFIEKIAIRPIVTAFTATASEVVKEDIIKSLKLNNPKVFVTGFDRENLNISIIKEGNKKDFVLNYIKSRIDDCGIIYCATRKDVDSITSLLNLNNINAKSYHAGLSDIERKQNQEDFIYDRVNVIVATNAFGMGIDKGNVRYVIHYSMPKSIEEYYQEIGRAGRDGEESDAIMLFSPGDVQTQRYLIDLSENQIRKEEQYKKLQQMVDLVYSKDCYRKYILNYFGDGHEGHCNFCSNCLDEGEEVDRTLDAQKVLSCIYRMKRNFGTVVVVDVLKGSKNKRILELNFDSLSTYGIMKELKKDSIKEFVNALISHGYIDLKGAEYPVITLNETSFDILKGNKKVLFKEKTITKVKEAEQGLFEELKLLRAEIAKERNVPPYVIFGDSSLKEISIKLPTSKTEFLNISGVGEKRYENYGEKFKVLVKNFLLKNNLKKDILTTSNVSTEIKELPFEVVTDKELLELLKELRKEFGRAERKLPQYVIPLKSLKEISGRYPLQIEHLKDITGMGPKKIESYGEELLSVIKDYIDSRSIITTWQNKGSRKIIIDGEGRSNEELSIDRLKENEDIIMLSEELEISLSTILGYVTNYIENKGVLDFSLNVKRFYNNDEKELIIEASNRLGYENIALLKKDLPKELKYESIRAVILDEFYIKNL